MIFSCFTRRSFQNVLQPWWIVYNDFHPVATEVTSSLLSLDWRLRLHPIVGLNDPKPDPIYASLRLAFHPECVLSARKCIAQYRLKFQIIPVNFFSGSTPAASNLSTNNHRFDSKKQDSTPTDQHFSTPGHDFTKHAQIVLIEKLENTTYTTEKEVTTFLEKREDLWMIKLDTLPDGFNQ